MTEMNPEQMETATGGLDTSKSSHSKAILADAIRMKDEGVSKSNALSALKKKYWNESEAYIKSVVAKVYG